MVETISPVVHGGRARWLGTVALHTLGAAGTAALFGAALGWIGRSLGAPWQRAGLLSVAAVAALYAAGALTRLVVPVPHLRRQVPDWWRTYFGRSIAAVLYGAGLGIGFLTYLSTGTLVVVAFAAVASGSPGLGAIFLTPFGLVRGLSAVVSWRSVTQDRSRALVDRLAAAPGTARRTVNGAALLATASLALMASLRTAPGQWWPFGAAVLAAVFSWAAVSKIVASRRWRRALSAYGLAPPIERVAAWGMAPSEALVALLVVSGAPRIAAVWAAALLVASSAALVHARRRVGDRVPCGCFGNRGSVARRTALARNALLIGVAALVIVTGTDAPAPWLPGIPVLGDAVPLTLTLGALVASVLAAWRGAVWLGRGNRL